MALYVALCYYDRDQYWDSPPEIEGCPSAGSAPATSATTVSMGVPSRPGVPAPAIA